MIKVLLTGSNGQLGNAIKYSIPENIRLIPLTKRELDLSDKKACEEVVREIKPNWVINAGAYTNVEEAEENPDLCLKINRDGPKHIAIGLKKTGGKLIHISTDYVFDGKNKNPYKVNEKRNPISVYGFSKSCGEEEIEKVMGNSGNLSIIRTSWLMGPTGKNFIKTMLNLHQSKDRIEVISDQIGSPTSTFSLSNLCWKIIKKFSITSKPQKMPVILHWSDEGETSWAEIARFIGEYSYELSIINRKSKVYPILSKDYSTKAKRPLYSSLDCSETEKLFNIKQVPWKNSIQSIIKEIMLQN